MRSIELQPRQRRVAVSLGARMREVSNRPGANAAGLFRLFEF
jgi:hypothetical protein